MKLLGFEVVNYGPFDRQFVPLAPGVTILAGLNNSGKTALLKAANLFASNEALPYIHPEYDSLFCIIYEPDDADRAQINGLNAAPFLPANSQGFLRAVFRIRDKSFREVEVVRADGKSAIWITVTGAQIHRFQITSDGQLSGRIVMKQLNVALPKEDDVQDILPNISEFKKCIWIPARRDGIGHSQPTTNTTLPVNGTNLASYLSTMQLNDADSYEALNNMFCVAFPYLKRINAHSLGNNALEVKATYSETGQKVPLSACGAGVEQLLILLTCVDRAPENALIAIDEPHSFLHPSAEKALVSFLGRYPKKTFLLATHSAVMINSVSPDRIVSVAKGGTTVSDYLYKRGSSDIAEILGALGYENSDLLFHNKLIFVEGPTEAGVLPKLLKKAGISEEVVDRIGMPQLEGANPIRNVDDMVKQMARYERLVLALGRARLPRLYLLDGDRSKAAIERMNLGDGAEAIILAKTEIENYILQPAAIVAAMTAEAKTHNQSVQVDEGEIHDQLTHLTAQGVMKGSELLKQIYASKE